MTVVWYLARKPRGKMSVIAEDLRPEDWRAYSIAEVLDKAGWFGKYVDWDAVKEDIKPAKIKELDITDPKMIMSKRPFIVFDIDEDGYVHVRFSEKLEIPDFESMDIEELKEKIVGWYNKRKSSLSAYMLFHLAHRELLRRGYEVKETIVIKKKERKEKVAVLEA